MNETTILEDCPNSNGQQEGQKNSSAWKHVTLGGVSGILMGAGVMYAGQAMAQPHVEQVTPQQPEESVTVPEEGETSHAHENGLRVASVNDNMSFGEAFASARSEVGPGGVFHWHGGIYNTYTAEEWNSMTPDQKHDFAQLVKPEIGVDAVSVPSDNNTYIIVEQHVETGHTSPHSEPAIISNDVHEPDVHIVGYGEFDGHLVVGIDMNEDDDPDVAIIDVDDSGSLTDPDIIIDSEGNISTYEEQQEQGGTFVTIAENPEVAPDMPDYMNNANIDDMNILV